MPGSIVRTGPNLVLVNDPEPLSTIYRWDRGRGLEAFFNLAKISMLPGDAELKVHDQFKRAFKQPVGTLHIYIANPLNVDYLAFYVVCS